MGYIGNAPYQGVLTGANIQDGTVDTADIANDAVTTVKIADGAVTTGKLAAGAAVPSQTGNSGKFLTTDGTNASWGTVDLASRVAKSGDTMTGQLTLEYSNARAVIKDGSRVISMGQWDGTNNRVEFSGANTLFAQYGTTDFIIANQTNGGLFKMDAYGRVTMPYQPMAFAYRSLSGTTTGGNYEIVYDSVQVNVGSHYNSSTGRFTCPVTGVYRVTAFGMGQLISGSYNFYVRPTKNGSGLGGVAYNYGDSGDYKHASGAWLVSCAAGDYLSIHSGGGSGYYGDGYAAASFELIG